MQIINNMTMHQNFQVILMHLLAKIVNIPSTPFMMKLEMLYTIVMKMMKSIWLI